MNFYLSPFYLWKLLQFFSSFNPLFFKTEPSSFSVFRSDLENLQLINMHVNLQDFYINIELAKQAAKCLDLS